MQNKPLGATDPTGHYVPREGTNPQGTRPFKVNPNHGDIFKSKLGIKRLLADFGVGAATTVGGAILGSAVAGASSGAIVGPLGAIGGAVIGASVGVGIEISYSQFYEGFDTAKDIAGASGIIIITVSPLSNTITIEGINPDGGYYKWTMIGANPFIQQSILDTGQEYEKEKPSLSK